MPNRETSPIASYYYFENVDSGITIEGGDTSGREGLRDVLRTYLPRLGFLRKNQIFEVHGLKIQVLDRTKFRIISYI